MRGPNKIASQQQVLDRLRRLPNDTLARQTAKRLAREHGDTLSALRLLQQHGDVEERHVKAHEKWLIQQAEDLV